MGHLVRVWCWADDGEEDREGEKAMKQAKEADEEKYFEEREEDI